MFMCRFSNHLFLRTTESPSFRRCLSTLSPCSKCLRSQPAVGGRVAQNQLVFKRGIQSSGEGRNLSKRGIFSWKGAAVLGALGLGVYGFIRYMKREKMLDIARANSVSIGEVAIGGPFQLVDHDGKAVTDKDFLGEWLLVYFGFTHCPDVCPEELDKITEVVDKLEKRGGGKIKTLFITLDPSRDTTKVMKEYVSEFSPDVIGLTGPQEQITAAANAYRIYHVFGPQDDDGDYIIDHSITTYLVNPDGKVMDFHIRTRSIDERVTSILNKKRKFEKEK